MPKYKFDFTVESDSEGTLAYEEDLSIPVRVKLKSIQFQTMGGNESRSHLTTVKVNGDIWADSVQVHDCEPFRFSKSINVEAGKLNLNVASEGFAPKETITVEGWIEYGLALF